MNEGHDSLRASDADREQAIEALKAAFAQNRLAKAEFAAHVGRALASRTYGELAAVTADVPAPPIRVQPPSAPTSMREQRTRRKVSQAELAEAVGVSRQTVILIESGRYLPSLPLAFTIARSLGLTVDETFADPRFRMAWKQPQPSEVGGDRQAGVAYASRVLVRHAPTTAGMTAQAMMTSTAVTAGIGNLKLFRAMLDPGWARVPTSCPGNKPPSAISRTKSRRGPRKLAR
jgi:putative transcriptional regulator